MAVSVITGQSQIVADYPVYPVPERYRLKGGNPLPLQIDNSQKKYFPPVFDQNGFSCNQASSIGYVFNYEVNRLRNLSSDSIQNLYTPGFVWNLLNSANWGVGVSYFDSWEIVKTAGCPNYVDYPFYIQGVGIWMSGYDKYYRAMQNRISLNYSLPVGTPEGLAIFKQYLVDHFENSPDGGVASFQIASSRMDTKTWKDPETDEQWPVIWTFGTEVGHAMTFVGYNDSVRIDLNHDGRCTNNIDINKDGLVDMKDWEVGALLAVNSWGKGFMKGGKAYVLYSVVAHEGNDGGIWNRSVHVIKAIKSYTPELTMRVVMRHEQRKRFSIKAGFSTDTSALAPQQTLSFPIFNHQGDNTPLEDTENPDDSRRFEFGLDITQFINSLEPDVPVKFFLVVEETDPDSVATGQVDEFAVIHYLNGADEVISKEKNVPVVNNGLTCVSLTESLTFNKLKVQDPMITNIRTGSPFYAQLSAIGGRQPYRWELVKDYKESTSSRTFTDITGDTLSNFKNEIPFRRVNLPFEFSFYGTKYRSVIADINGALHFDNEYFQYPYAVNEDLAFRVRKSIVPFGADIEVNLYGDVLIYQPSDSVVSFEWKASVYTGLKVYPLSVIARLFADGRIEFHYGNRSVPPDKDYQWQVGISNGDQSLFKYASVSESRQLTENTVIAFSPSDYPANLVLSEDGTLSGLASEKDHQWDILVKVSDSYHQVQYSVIPISTVTKDTVTVKSRISPNPFYRSTGISFTITEEMLVTLDIYDFSGRRIKGILNQTLLPGEFTCYWNARDEYNHDVSAGIYIYELRTGSARETGKVVLLR